ncbi:hypothetical protein N0V95_005656 [Ascochyta clinopodiicola]|nr:hypothetical protein N0V95_005656 [Ascochyta clinopodiicola]
MSVRRRAEWTCAHKEQWLFREPVFKHLVIPMAFMNDVITFVRNLGGDFRRRAALLEVEHLGTIFGEPSRDSKLYMQRKFRVDYGQTAGLYTTVDKMFLKAWDQAMGPVCREERDAYNEFKDSRLAGLDDGDGDQLMEEIETLNQRRLAKKHSWAHNAANALANPSIASDITRESRGRLYGHIGIYFLMNPALERGNLPGWRSHMIFGPRAAEAWQLREKRRLQSLGLPGAAASAVVETRAGPPTGDIEEVWLRLAEIERLARDIEGRRFKLAQVEMQVAETLRGMGFAKAFTL